MSTIEKIIISYVIIINVITLIMLASTNGKPNIANGEFPKLLCLSWQELVEVSEL